ncbi:MAG: leucyl aminopeptidase [Planctomycetota bacterium]
MKIRSAKSAAPKSELTVVFAVDGAAGALPGALKDAFEQAKKTGDLKDEARAQCVFHPSKGPARLGCISLGKSAEIDTERLRRCAAIAQAMAEDRGVRSFELVLTSASISKVAPEAAGAAIAEGLVLGAYRYQPPKKNPPKPRKGHECTIVFLGAEPKSFASGLARGERAALATNYARDLENMAGNLCTPTVLANAAKKLAGNGVRVKVLGQAAMTRLKMGALLGVAKGSSEPAKFVVLEYGKASTKDVVCVIGKGLTFDSGGISIKPAAKMDEMRYDMCGAGAVLGLFHALKHGAMAGTKSKRRIVGLIAAAENMVGPDAQKPGDIVRAMDGHTIEVLNTDAEGRLVLCDAIAYAKKFHAPKQIVDLATLTGAVVVALGHEVAGVLGNDQKLIDSLLKAGKAADEPLWQLPLWDVHKDQMKSKFADLANINGGQGGGTIAGAAFLSFFAGDTPWAHLDIAGTAWGGISKDYYRSGASGTAVRTLLAFLNPAS